MANPRVIISSDIGGSDNDDMESMAHALLHADKLDIHAIISTPTKHAGRTSDIYKALDAYSKDYNNLKTWGDYPAPDSLKSVVYQGNINVPGPSGYSNPTAGSKAIIKAAHESSAPLYVLAWGALTDVAQALHDDPSIAGNLRILSSNGWNGTQDPYSREYIYNNFKDVWWVESKSTHRGIYVNSSGSEGNSFNMNEAKGHGALGDYFYNARPYGVKMGDSWSTAYLLDSADNNNPGANSWGGTFKQTGHGSHYWTDDTNPAVKVGSYNGAAYVRAHQGDIYNDFYKVLAKADAPKSGSSPKPPVNTDDPVTAKNDTAATDKGKSVIVKVLQNDSAPDGGLKISSADSTSAKGGKVALHSDGTITYTPKDGYTGSDTFKYVANDADGDKAGATVTVTVKAPATHDPAPQPGSGDNNLLVAKDDSYTIDVGKKLYFNTSHLLYNDKSPDGGVKVTSIDAKSSDGVTLEKWNDGTIVYKSATGGTDSIKYTVMDKAGHTDAALVNITVKGGTIVSGGTGDHAHDQTPTPTPTPTPISTPPSAGNGSVVAHDDNYKVDSGKTLYLNTRFVTMNDKSAHGGLDVVSVDAASDRGVKISWGAEGTKADGTLIYHAPTGFTGIDKIDYKVVDSHGGSDIGTILVHVNDIFH